ncbi:MAG TPA: DnaJ C-terminal domain-containing protein [Ktedonobacteraceae bacterium]|nr:DnaJ C-terminal domain-containing protein [Ktedonobacteraceae bacterium]
MAYAVPPERGDIRATLALSQAEAQNGSSRTLNLPGGRRITVPIQAGVHDGQEVRLPGQGEAAWDGGPIGDLILTISIARSPLSGQSNPVIDPNSPTEYISKPSFPPAAPAPNYPPATAGAMPYTAYPPQAEYTATTPAGAYPDYASQSPQEQMYLPQNQNAYTAPPPYPGYPPPGQVGPPSYSPPPPTRRRVSPAIITLIIILVLLLLAGSGLIYYVGVYQPKVQRDQATATAQAQLTATANSQSSATAAANATVTAQAQATANAQATVNAQASATATALQNILTTVTSGTPILSDTLSAQSSSNWDILQPANSSVGGSCQFTNGAYHSNMPQKGYFQPCYAENPTFANFAFQVQMTITQGDEGGILFRADPTNSKFYLFRVATDGTYDLFLYTGSQASSAHSLLYNTAQNFKTGLNQPNTITLVAQGDNLYFYINNEFLASVSNNTFASGKIGVFGEDSTNPTDAAFTNAQVWQL